MKYYKLYCDTYHCDTEFLVKVKDEEDQPDCYVCPECGNMVWIKDEDIIDIKCE